MRKILAIGLFLGLLSFPLMAQDYPKAEVFGGYQYLHLGGITENGQTSDGQSFNGWNASLTGNFTRHLGVQGDFGGAYATIGGVSTHVYTYTGGPVISLNAGGRVNPFVHALFGGANVGFSVSGASISKTGFSMLFGGGIDARANHAISVRLIQVDWLYYHFGAIADLSSSSLNQSNNVRISTGIVLTF